MRYIQYIRLYFDIVRGSHEVIQKRVGTIQSRFSVFKSLSGFWQQRFY